MNELKIGPYSIGSGNPPFIVAEMSGNHNQSLERALMLVDAAKAAGAHAIKLQTYTADTMTLDIHEGEFLIEDKQSLWCGKSLYELYQEAYTPWEWHEPIFKRCHQLGMLGFSTPFDDSSVDFLEKLNVPCYKIASLEITDHRLIRKAALTGKPIMISTGAATIEEIDEAVSVVRKAENQNIILLKCTSAYPAPPDEINLRTIPHLANTFQTIVGLSDHTAGVGVAVASIAFGSCVIEKHLTLSRADGGVDAAFSLEPAEFTELTKESLRAWQALGQVQYGVTESEKTSLSHRRSLYFVKDLKAEETITPEHIQAIRPGFGLPTKEYDRLIGRQVSKDVKRGEAVKWDLIKSESSEH
jgi:pseudaminic acid synthase